MHERLLVPDPPVTEVGATEHVSPLVGETVTARIMVPLKPSIGVTVIVEFPATLGLVFTMLGLPLTEKLVNVNGTVTELVTDLSTPVTVTA